MNALGFDGCRIISNREDDGISLDLKSLAFLVGNDYRAVLDLLDAGFEIYGQVVCLEAVTKVGGVCKADAGGDDEVIHHLNDRGLLALKEELVCDLASCQTAADDNDLFANLFLAEEEIDRFDRLFNSGDRDSLCLCAGSNDHLVRAERLDIGDFGVQLNCDGGVARDLSSVPRDERAILFFEGRGSRRDEYAAELARLFIESYAVAALCADDSGFHTADTAADDGDLLCLLCRLNVIFLRLHRLGVESAACKSHGVGEILGVCVTLRGREVEASRVTADAGLDVLDAVFNELGDPFGVGQELTRNAHTVDLTLCDGSGTRLGIHTTRANDGNIDELLDVSNVLKVAVFGHIHRRMSPVPGVISTVVGVEHIVARIL